MTIGEEVLFSSQRFTMSEIQSFENFIIKCCELDEWDLRDFLREKLTAAGFTIQEDDYKSYRTGQYQKVHNMLAMRGEPKVCLVAHTDVCRDHGSRREHKKAKPVIKEVSRFGKESRIIQDENCAVQVGGDDRLGVAINTWIALNTGYDLGLLFTTDEEVGNCSADYANFKEFMHFDLFVQVDRGNHSRQLVTNIGGVKLCDTQMANTLLQIAEDIGLPRVPVIGLMTDVLALKSDNKIKAAVNMTCGYHGSIGSSPNEYIEIDEAKDTLRYVSEIIKYFDLQTDETINTVDTEIHEIHTIINEEKKMHVNIANKKDTAWN